MAQKTKMATVITKYFFKPFSDFWMQNKIKENVFFIQIQNADQKIKM
jgi:uncharacterized protein (DUF486 family)